MAKPIYNRKQRDAVVARALEAVNAAGEKYTEITLGDRGTRQNFDLDAGGMCNRFVRQVFETALKLTPYTWTFRAAEAWQTLAKLRPWEVPVTDRKPGDILGCPGDPGHIALYLGDVYGDGRELVAENTISTKRGYPRRAGTKVSAWTDFRRQHSGVSCYRLFA